MTSVCTVVIYRC